VPNAVERHEADLRPEANDNVVEPDRSAGAALRERRRRRTAAEIERAALELFAKRGFEAVTVDEIAAEVDISRRTFFRYYASKDAVLLGDPRRDEQLLMSALARQPASVPPVAALHAALIEMTKEIERDAISAQLRFQVYNRAPAAFAAAISQRQFIHDDLEPLIALRMGIVDEPTDMRPALIVRISLAAAYVGLMHWLRTCPDESPDGAMTKALRVAAEGLASIECAPANDSG